MKLYKISAVYNGNTLYFNKQCATFLTKCATAYKGKAAAKKDLEYVKKCAPNDEILNTIKIVEIF
jgi:hypothetical protein